MTPIRPLGNRILAKIEEDKEIVQNGIIMPKTQIKRIVQAMVIAVGDEIEDINHGDVILVDRFSGQEIPFDDQKYLMFDLDTILAMIDQKGTCESSDELALL